MKVLERWSRRSGRLHRQKKMFIKTFDKLLGSIPVTGQHQNGSVKLLGLPGVLGHSMEMWDYSLLISDPLRKLNTLHYNFSSQIHQAVLGKEELFVFEQEAHRSCELWVRTLNQYLELKLWSGQTYDGFTSRIIRPPVKDPSNTGLRVVGSQKEIGQYFEIVIPKQWQVSFVTCEGRIWKLHKARSEQTTEIVAKFVDS